MAHHPRDSARRARLANAWRDEVPPRPDPGAPPAPPRRLEVFAVGTDTVQCTWSALGPGRVTFRVDGAEPVTVEADGGPGAATIAGLTPGALLTVRVVGPAVDVALDTMTLRRPAGALLHRIATVSDSHLGSRATGYFHTLAELPEPEIPHPQRCLAAAVQEAAAWGAADLVVKGDLVDRSVPEWWARAAAVLASAPLDAHAVAGNHERSGRGDGDPDRSAARAGIDLVADVAAIDRPGVRLVLADSTVAGADHGRYDPIRDAVVDAVATSPTQAIVATHHQPLATPVPTYLPPGVPRRESLRLFGALAATGVPVLVTTGHTHRHRRRRLAGVTVSEVGSTKDFPGTWAGYEIYEGGMVQVVHRIAEPSCIRWTDWTRRAAAGLWQHWSPGRLTDRCFTR